MPKPASRSAFLGLSLLLLVSCGPKPVSLEDYGTTLVTLPAGQKIRAEALTNPLDMARGMMFRDHLDPDRGMLFIHGTPGKNPYWMFQCKIPLDIIWMDSDRNVVEISADTPPCRKPASECPNYGGTVESRYVLELAGGMAKKYGVQVGDRITF